MMLTEFVEAVKEKVPELVRCEMIRDDRVRYYTAYIPERGTFYVEIPVNLRILDDVDVNVFIERAADDIIDILRYHGVIKEAA